eukprot:CAMPEP_0176127424 /NCGR_PEP_ID=MMETSP0120_2-20121206/64354_1 /TAXON_ID=160619 /ORGANISM="Kryptoperidinium foliaceum, Strain CCMP 1326" /LENGTH=97 /DNA_ID=CAMNT_0017462441 /DNA_START=218 /DNA_END=511 /DNA_ORIENTATION=-
MTAIDTTTMTKPSDVCMGGNGFNAGTVLVEVVVDEDVLVIVVVLVVSVLLVVIDVVVDVIVVRRLGSLQKVCNCSRSTPSTMIVPRLAVEKTPPFCS